MTAAVVHGVLHHGRRRGDAVPQEFVFLRIDVVFSRAAVVGYIVKADVCRLREIHGVCRQIAAAVHGVEVVDVVKVRRGRDQERTVLGAVAAGEEPVARRDERVRACFNGAADGADPLFRARIRGRCRDRNRPVVERVYMRGVIRTHGKRETALRVGVRQRLLHDAVWQVAADGQRFGALRECVRTRLRRLRDVNRLQRVAAGVVADPVQRMRQDQRMDQEVRIGIIGILLQVFDKGIVIIVIARIVFLLYVGRRKEVLRPVIRRVRDIAVGGLRKRIIIRIQDRPDRQTADLVGDGQRMREPVVGVAVRRCEAVGHAQIIIGYAQVDHVVEEQIVRIDSDDGDPVFIRAADKRRGVGAVRNVLPVQIDADVRIRLIRVGTGRRRRLRFVPDHDRDRIGSSGL